MKRKSVILLAIIFIFSLALIACGKTHQDDDSEMGEEQTTPDKDVPSDGKGNQNDTGNSEDKWEVSVLVAYFSCTNKTKGVAQKIALSSDGTLYEITPKDPYTSDDLNYNNDNCRANREQNDRKARPEINGIVEHIERYDVIFLGYPIWWGEEPRIIDTFLESYDFSDKTIIPFCTSGGSGISTSQSNIHAIVNDANWQDGKRFVSTVSQNEVNEWVKSILDNIPKKASRTTKNRMKATKTRIRRKIPTPIRGL